MPAEVRRGRRAAEPAGGGMRRSRSDGVAPLPMLHRYEVFWANPARYALCPAPRPVAGGHHRVVLPLCPIGVTVRSRRDLVVGARSDLEWLVEEERRQTKTIRSFFSEGAALNSGQSCPRWPSLSGHCLRRGLCRWALCWHRACLGLILDVGCGSRRCRSTSIRRVR